MPIEPSALSGRISVVFGKSSGGTGKVSITLSSVGFSAYRCTAHEASTPTSPILRASALSAGQTQIVTSAFDCLWDRIRLGEVHAVKLVAGKYQYLVGMVVERVVHGRPHCVGRPLKPVAFLRRLLGGEDVDEAVRELVEPVCLHDVAVEARGKELGQHEDALDPRVDAVGQRYVDDPVLARKTDRRLGALQRQRIEPCAPAAAEDYSRYSVLSPSPRRPHATF